MPWLRLILHQRVGLSERRSQDKFCLTCGRDQVLRFRITNAVSEDPFTGVDI